MDNQKQAEEALIRAVEDFVHALRSGLLYREPQQESTEGREMMLFLQLNPQATISQIQNRLAELQLQKQDSICCGYPEITAAFYDAIPAEHRPRPESMIFLLRTGRPSARDPG